MGLNKKRTTLSKGGSALKFLHYQKKDVLLVENKN